VVGAVLALSHVFVPHCQIKWQHHLIAGLDVVPGRLEERLALLLTTRTAEALQVADALLTETALLAQAHAGAGISSFLEALSERRRPVDPPNPDQLRSGLRR
jgi:hypothetical protein